MVKIPGSIVSAGLLLLAVPFAVPASALAQSPTSRPARKFDKALFLRNDYETEIRIHVGELTNIGLVDEMRKSPIWPFVRRTLNPMRFRVDDIEWLTILPATDEAREVVAVIEGRADAVKLPKPGSKLLAGNVGSWMTSSHHDLDGRHALLVTPGWQGDPPSKEHHMLWVNLEPGVVMYGPRIEFEAALAGKTKRGIPSMQVLEMRGHRSLISVVHSLRGADADVLGDFLETKAWITEANPLERMALRLSEPEEERFVVDLVLRFRKAGAEPKALVESLRAKHAELIKQPEFRMLRPSFDTVSIKVSGLDVAVKWSMGDADEAIAMLTNVALMQLALFLRTLADGPFADEVEFEEIVEDVEVVEPEELESPFEPPQPGVPPVENPPPGGAGGGETESAVPC